MATDDDLANAIQIAEDCAAYFSGNVDRYTGLGALFAQTWRREPGTDYFPAISQLCLDNESWLFRRERWTQGKLTDFASEFRDIVPVDCPNY